MLKKIGVIVFAGLLSINMCGCLLLLAGGVGGAGTAVWLSGKLTQEVKASYEQTVNAAVNALKSLDLEITKEAKEANVTQIKSRYSDGKEIWIDVRKITENSSKIEVRVGGVSSDKAAADKILKRIQKYL